MKYFSTSLEHILAELERIDLLLQVCIWQARQTQEEDPSFRGLYLSEVQIDHLLSKPMGTPYWASAFNSLRSTDFLERLQALRESIDQQKELSVERGISLRLCSIAEKFKLSTLEVDILLIVLAAEIDLRYERFYAYLQDDVTKKQPSADLAISLLSSSLEEKLEMRKSLGQSSLVKYHLMYLIDDPSQPHTSSLGKLLKLDTRIVNFLLAEDEIDVNLSSVLQRVIPQISWDSLILSKDFKQRLRQFSSSHVAKTFYFVGARGTGKQTTAEAMCAQMGLCILIIDTHHLLNLEDSSIIVKLRLICREAILQNAALYWKEDDSISFTKRCYWREKLMQLLHEQEIVLFLVSESKEKIETASYSPMLVEFTVPTMSERMQIWQKFIPNIWQLEADLIEISSKFRLSGGDIRQAITTAENIARWRDPANPQITSEDCYEACRRQSNEQLGIFARRIKPHYQWQDIILPEEQLQQLQEICGHVKYRSLVYDEWGFDRKLALGKGLTILFSGSSGTGKTMAADIIAGELGLNLYKIDLSTVVSKYIGETEKNLSLVFQEAESSHSVLFFDEADALFGKRSDVKDAHDRYANIETGYLLQRMEEYEGIVILATNLQKNMDDAFIRRLQFSINFPFPNERDRLRIWKRVFPDTSPLDSQLNLSFIARQFELSGGNIRNIALAAAFLAANDGRLIKRQHIIHAIRREYQKIGRIITEQDFEGYLNSKSK